MTLTRKEHTQKSPSETIENAETMNVVTLENTPIIEQLRLEEALLRVGKGTWCIVNKGTTPAMVMGISGKANKWFKTDDVKKLNIPIIKRFSGGGSVAVDEDTFFVTFIADTHLLGVEHPIPENIMSWSKNLYGDVFDNKDVTERGGDYVFGDKKFAGNAHYIRRGRWLHHTSFLWSYNPTLMNLLRDPPRSPEYRAGRNHEDFLCTMSEFLPNKNAFFTS